MSALEGIRVIELASERGAYAGKMLADMGADVVLVEPPGGAPSRRYPPFAEGEAAGNQSGLENSLYWWHYNTSKRGVVIDLDLEAGRAAFRKLVETADLLVESEAPGRLDALALDYADLIEHRSDLIHVSITPFGRDNPRRDEPVTDLTILAGGGPVWSCGYDDPSMPPIRGGGNQGYQTACHYAAMSALTAILYHGISGEGQFIDVSMHAAANVTTEMASYFWLVERSTVIRQTGRHAMPMRTLPVQVECADGGYVTTGMPPRTPRGFGDLYDWMQELGLTSQLPESIFLDKARHRESIGFADIGVDDEVTAIYSASREATEIIARALSMQAFFEGAQRIGLTVGAIYSPEEAYENPHFVERGYQVEVEHPELGRRIRYPGAPYLFSASPWSISRRAPRLDEHGAEIWDELDLDAELREQVR